VLLLCISRYRELSRVTKGSVLSNYEKYTSIIVRELDLLYSVIDSRLYLKGREFLGSCLSLARIAIVGLGNRTKSLKTLKL